MSRLHDLGPLVSHTTCVHRGVDAKDSGGNYLSDQMQTAALPRGTQITTDPVTGTTGDWTSDVAAVAAGAAITPTARAKVVAANILVILADMTFPPIC
ncbi:MULTISPECIES: hypothetical protein [Nocardia]|uniref:hypothetical protein n=1 Tax=Nocardia TaxID=1817 RepID=UPI00189359D6|nr:MULTISPECIES: hypothetical protein [Nocardia]MBF6351450.1 hypothetical protein [Nocardia flavorosea]